MSQSELNAGSKLFSLGDLAGLFDGYLVLTDDMVIAGVSGKFAGSLGYQSDDLIGKGADKICNDPTLILLRSSLADLLAAGQAGRREMTMLHRSRRPMTKPVSILRICDAGQGYLVLLDEESAAFGESASEISRSTEKPPSNPDLRSLSAIEMTHILQVLAATGGNRTKASEILGISRVTLLSKIKQYGMRSET